MPSPLSPDDLDPLRAYATPRQAEYLDAIAEHGSVGKAARALGIDRRLIFGALARPAFLAWLLLFARRLIRASGMVSLSCA